MHQFVLASTSPRRRQLLEQGGYIFRTSSIKVSEIPKKNLNLPAQVRDLARRKALSFLQSANYLESRDKFVLSADTVVILDSEILGKPESKNENITFLKRLSAKKHLVITGVCVFDTVSKLDICFHESTIIEFKELLESEMDSYVESEDGLDKAGGYGIQSGAKGFVKNIFGSYSNVVGLPMEKLQQVLVESGWKLPQRTS